VIFVRVKSIKASRSSVIGQLDLRGFIQKRLA
jgi:hypothetical protein